jgi:LytS/YehU family sensor histidine kinase
MPGMIIQPFVENAIEHGFNTIDYKGLILISFVDDKEQIKISIEDNGIGNTDQKKVKNHKSRAMQIIKDRLYLFNKQNNSSASYVIDNTKENGFKIIVSLPKIY